MLPLIKDEGGGHVVGQEADLHFGGDELHGDVIGHPVDGDSGVLVHLPGDAVEEALLQPLSGLRAPDGGTCLLIALQRRGTDAGMNSCIIGAHDVLSKNDDSRESAAWVDAVKTLEATGMLECVNFQHKMYRLTNDGWKEADIFIEQNDLQENDIIDPNELVKVLQEF